MTNKLLWHPDTSAHTAAASNHLGKFAKQLNLSGDYFELHNYSISNPHEFWSGLWDYLGLLGDKGEDPLAHNKGEEVLAYNQGDAFCDAKWFSDSHINYAENILHLNERRGKDSISFISEDGKRTDMSYEELHSQVQSCSAALSAVGIKKGDVVAGWLANCPHSIIAMLATAKLGAIWSSCSPDFGVPAILDRFGQLNPKVLFTHDYYSYKGKQFPMDESIAAATAKLTSVTELVRVPFLDSAGNWDDFLSKGDSQNLTAEYERVEFNHPLFIMFSSGTTGKPKCIVHSHGGVLLKHCVELFLQTDLGPNDKLFYFTTCGWMMWNWMLSGLLCGTQLVLYDGNPLYPTPDRLLKLWSDEKVTVAGVSAKLIEGWGNHKLSGSDYNLQNLRMLCSTGSPLSTTSFNYVYEKISQDICLASISGGTDILGCFVMGTPSLPVHCGEIQAPTLGMDVQVYDEQGGEITASNTKGELVCASPFPSVPIMFWGDDANKTNLRKAYFDKFSGVWTHGDYIEKTNNGGYVIHGRSDNTLNPGGVRIGTAEIYRQVEKLTEVTDSLAVGQEWQDDTRIILFVVLQDAIVLDDELSKKISTTIRSNTSPRHVPAKIIQVADLPRTISGKISEQAVRCAIHNQPINNLSALANPESLEYFKDLQQLQS